MNNNDKKKNKKTLESLMCRPIMWAIFGFVIGNSWNNILNEAGGLIGIIVGFGFGIIFRKFVHKKNSEKNKENDSHNKKN